MGAFNRSTVYGKVVPALAILLGLSYAFIDIDAVHNTLLFLLAATAALGWLAPTPRSPEELSAAQQRRQARRDLRFQRRYGQLPQQTPGQPAPGQPAPSGNQQPQGQAQFQGPVLDGIPQDKLGNEERER